MNELLKRIIQRPEFKSGKGIAQGDPLSPLFLNIFLHEYLDVPFTSSIVDSSLLYYRYVDDLCVFGLSSKEDALSIIARIQELLRPIGLGLREGYDGELEFFLP